MSAIVFGIPIKATFTYEFLKELVKAMTTPEQWATVRRGLCKIRDNRPRDEWVQRWVNYLYDIVTSESDPDSDDDADSDYDSDADDAYSEEESLESDVDQAPYLGPGFSLGVDLWIVEETGQAIIGVLISKDFSARMKELVQIPRLYGGDEINRFGKVNPKAMNFFSPYVCGPVGYYKVPLHICDNCLTRLQD